MRFSVIVAYKATDEVEKSHGILLNRQKNTPKLIKSVLQYQA